MSDLVNAVIEAINKGNIDEAKKFFLDAMCKLDKAANKKIIHKNKASRKKSVLNKKLNQLMSSRSHTSA